MLPYTTRHDGTTTVQPLKRTSSLSPKKAINALPFPTYTLVFCIYRFISHYSSVAQKMCKVTSSRASSSTILSSLMAHSLRWHNYCLKPQFIFDPYVRVYSNRGCGAAAKVKGWWCHWSCRRRKEEYEEAEER